MPRKQTTHSSSKRTRTGTPASRSARRAGTRHGSARARKDAGTSTKARSRARRSTAPVFSEAIDDHLEHFWSAADACSRIDVRRWLWDCQNAGPYIEGGTHTQVLDQLVRVEHALRRGLAMHVPLIIAICATGGPALDADMVAKVAKRLLLLFDSFEPGKRGEP